MTGNKNFDQGANPDETTPWSNDSAGWYDQTYRVSGRTDQYQGADERQLVQHGVVADRGWRNEPITQGGGINVHPETHEVMGNAFVRMSQTVSLVQYDNSHTIAVQRGMPGQADYPTSGPRIPARQVFGLGSAYGRPGPSGHDPADDSVAGNYLRDPDPLAKYGNGDLSARSILPPQDYGSVFPREHERSQFETMGDVLGQSLAEYGPHSNRDVGQQLPRGRKAR